MHVGIENSGRKRDSIIKEFKTHESDTGSLEVQVALLTYDIERLNMHFEQFPKDYASRRGLLEMVHRRRKFLDILRKDNKESYENIIKRLGLRK